MHLSKCLIIGFFILATNPLLGVKRERDKSEEDEIRKSVPYEVEEVLLPRRPYKKRREILLNQRMPFIADNLAHRVIRRQKVDNSKNEL